MAMRSGRDRIEIATRPRAETSRPLERSPRARGARTNPQPAGENPAPPPIKPSCESIWTGLLVAPPSHGTICWLYTGTFCFLLVRVLRLVGVASLSGAHELRITPPLTSEADAHGSFDRPTTTHQLFDTANYSSGCARAALRLGEGTGLDRGRFLGRWFALRAAGRRERTVLATKSTATWASGRTRASSRGHEHPARARQRAWLGEDRLHRQTSTCTVRTTTSTRATVLG